MIIFLRYSNPFSTGHTWDESHSRSYIRLITSWANHVPLRFRHQIEAFRSISPPTPTLVLSQTLITSQQHPLTLQQHGLRLTAAFCHHGTFTPGAQSLPIHPPAFPFNATQRTDLHGTQTTAPHPIQITKCIPDYISTTLLKCSTPILRAYWWQLGPAVTVRCWNIRWYSFSYQYGVQSRYERRRRHAAV